LNTNEVKKIMVKDTMLYLPARIIEGAIGLLTISLYTRFFAPDVYGTYGIITTTVNISSLLLRTRERVRYTKYENAVLTAATL
jgi:O-antigen/teichoic acid export membrane protein